MNDQNRRSALQVVTDAARKIKAAARIVRAALTGGLHGAAIAAAKEALPTIVKFAVGFVIAVVVIPMFVISAMPSMFFGYVPPKGSLFSYHNVAVKAHSGA